MPTNPKLDEYLRRNILHCSSVGATSNTQAVLTRLRKNKRTPKWCIEALEGILCRCERVSKEMAIHRDELSPYK